MKELKRIVEKAIKFREEAHSILSIHEESSSRIIQFDQTYRNLGKLSLNQDDLFRQSLRCVENKLFRAAHVMAWASFMDFLEEKISSDNLKKLRKIRPKWKSKTIEDLREEICEYQLIDAAKDLGLCTKNQSSSLKGLLSKRNECAHPSEFYPELNDTLGYISDIIKRIKIIQLKYI